MRTTGIAAGAALALACGAWGQALRGTVEQHSFVGPVSGRTVLYNIYLPEGYAASTQRYPVVYHFHGIGGNQGGGQNTQVPGAFETALAACRIGPVIVVFPNGYTDNFWADSFDGLEPAETNVVPELLSHVDAAYRTIPDASNRVAEGFSMGGFGTMKFYSKFPELFACAVEYDGALSTWQDIVRFQPQVASAVFNNSETYFNIYSPWTWCTTNAPTLRQGLKIRMVAGALVTSNRRFRDFLTGLAIPVEYIETGCDHNLACLLSAQGQNSASFIAARLTPFVAGAHACRGAPVVLTAQAAGKAPFGYQWQAADAGAPGGWRTLTDGDLVLGGRVVASVTGATLQGVTVTPAAGAGVAGIQLRCIVTSACAAATSNAATLWVCAADFNCDGFVDFFDADAYFAAFEAGEGAADFNGDGFLDFFDADAFVGGFEAGC